MSTASLPSLRLAGLALAGLLALGPRPAAAAPQVSSQCDGSGPSWDALQLGQKIERFLQCDGLTIAEELPQAGVTLAAFRTGGAKGGGRAWHLAFLLGDGARAASPLAKVPGIEALAASLRPDAFAVILSEKDAAAPVADLAPALRPLVASLDAATQIAPTVDVAGNPPDALVLRQGVNLLARLAAPAPGSPLGLLAAAAAPGSTKASGPWHLRGLLGPELARPLLAKVPGLTLDPPAGAAALGLDLFVPAFTPFPFALLQDKRTLHAEVEAAHLHVDLARSAGGAQVHVHAESFEKYWVLNPDHPFPIRVTGDLVLEKGEVSGKMEADYQVPPAEDPLGFLPGVHLTRLLVGGALDHQGKGSGKSRTDLTFETAAEVALGDAGERVRASLELEVAEAAGGKATLKDLRLRLHGAADGGKISLGKLGALGRLPVAKELVLDEAAFGIMPRPGELPDFYLIGGVTWTRTNMGGQLAVQKHTPKGSHEEAFFLFVTQNDFSIAGLFPETEAFEGPRAIAQALKLPRTMLAFNTLKGDGTGEPVELAVADMPEPMRPMFQGFVSAAAGTMPVYADSLTLVGALDFSQAEKDDIAAGFRKLGLDRFGPEGPLLVAGSIGGLTSGQLSLAIAAELPGFEFPATIAGKPNPVAELVHPKGLAFFMRLVVEGDPRLEVGVEGDLGVNLPRLDDFGKLDPQDLKGQVFLRATAEGQVGLFVAGDKAGTWTDPLGFNENLGIQDTALILGLDVDPTGEASINLGLGGTLVFDVAASGGGREKLSYEGDLFLGAGFRPEIPFVTPSKFGVNLRASELSPQAAVRIADALYDGVLQGGLANVVGKLLPPDARSTYDAVRGQLAKASLTEVLHLDQVPLPLLKLTPATGQVDAGPPMVKFYFATPGTAIPGRPHMQGLGFAVAAAGELDLLGQKHTLGQFDFTLTLADGLRVMGEVPPFQVGQLQVGDPKAGSKLDVAASAARQGFDLTAHLGLPPLLDDTTKISLALDKSSIQVKKHLQDVFDLTLDIEASLASPPVFTVDASVDNGLDAVARDRLLPALGVPRAVARELVAKNPISFEHFRLKSDLVGFATGTGEPIAVDLQPRYFGDLRPAIAARIPPLDWNHPERILLGGQELPGKILASMVDYMVEKKVAIELPDIDLGVLALTGCRFGAARDDERRVFLLGGAAKLLASRETLRLELAPTEARFQTEVDVVAGAVKAKLRARAPLKDSKLQDMAFEAEVDDGLADFVASRVLPAVGIPAPVASALAGAVPLEVARLRFRGGVAALVTGQAEVEYDLEPQYFGTPGAPIQGKVPRLDPDKPLEALLLGPDVVAALARGLVEFLMANPREVPALDLGPLKLEAGHLGGAAVTGFDHPDQQSHVFQLSGGLAALASHPQALVQLSPRNLAATFTESLAGGALSGRFTVRGEVGASTLAMHGAVGGDLGRWLQAQGAAGVRQVLAGVDPGLTKAQQDLAAAQGKVDELSRTIDQLRGQVQAERARATSPIPAAENTVNQLRGKVAGIQGQVRGLQGQIHPCNQNTRLCFFGKCKVVPDYIARGICQTGNLAPQAALGPAQVALGAAQLALGAAEKSLETLRQGVTNIPVDADPRVAAVIAAKGAADLALGAARQAVAAGQLGGQLMAQGAASLGGGVQLRQGDLYGRVPEALGGEGMILDLEFTAGGATFHDRLALSLTDEALNSRQLGALALGVAVRGIVLACEQEKLVPHDLLGRVEALYYPLKQAADAEVARLEALIPGAPPKEPSSLLAAIQEGGAARVEGQ